MKLQLEIKGAKELDDMLRQLPATVSRRAAVDALRAGARVIRDEARRLAPVGPDGITRKLDYADAQGGVTAAGSGGLRRAIRVRTDTFRGGTLRRVVVVVSNKGAGINPHWIEYGTAATRVAKRKGYMTFVIDGRLIRKREVAGIRERPFMRPAAARKFEEAVKVIGERLGHAIEVEAVRLGKRFGAR